MAKHEADDKVVFGFWIYLMTDLIVFATLFATFLVLRGNSWDGPTSNELFNLPFVFTETMLLLFSSFTCGLGMIAVSRKHTRDVLTWFIFTFLLGASFLGMELYEFHHLISEGNSFTRSGFLSSFFTLVGTHGLHILIGLIWIATLIVYIMKKGLNDSAVRKLTLLSLFWHFLDLVWIFIFTIVYLMGVL